MVRKTLILLFLGLLVLFIVTEDRGSSTLELWHTEKLENEFDRDTHAVRVNDFSGYLELEQALFEELDSKIYSRTETGPAYLLNRYSAGSLTDPSGAQPNWNRSFSWDAKMPKGGVLLLHGMSDSPYSLRTLAQALQGQGYHVIGLRLPGHGTVPSALRHAHWEDMAAAVQLAMEQLIAKSPGRPVHVIGYSTGASLAINYTLDQLESELPAPSSLVLISPAIRVHPFSALAGIKDSLSVIPGLGNWAYVSIMDEFDPYKYNSFATNAAAQVHAVTKRVVQRIQALQGSPILEQFPPVLVHKSAVDATVTTAAVVDNLLLKLPGQSNELVLFDINRHELFKSALLIADPAPLADRLVQDAALPFTLTTISNKDTGSYAVEERRRNPFARDNASVTPLLSEWPRDVVSLSHVALVFSPDDPLYGRTASQDSELIFLGNLAFYGERGLLRIPPDWLLRMRHNPFYDYLEQRTVDWLETAELPPSMD